MRNILNDFNALLQHFVMVLSVEMEVERNHWPTLRVGALGVADDGEPQLSIATPVPLVNQNDIVGADVRVEVIPLCLPFGSRKRVARRPGFRRRRT